MNEKMKKTVLASASGIGLEYLPAALLDVEQSITESRKAMAGYTMLIMIFSDEKNERKNPLMERRYQIEADCSDFITRLRNILDKIIEFRFEDASLIVKDDNEYAKTKNSLTIAGNDMVNEAIDLDDRLYTLVNEIKDYYLSICIKPDDPSAITDMREVPC